jgi:hypothetical protein
MLVPPIPLSDNTIGQLDPDVSRPVCDRSQ